MGAQSQDSTTDDHFDGLPLHGLPESNNLNGLAILNLPIAHVKKDAQVYQPTRTYVPLHAQVLGQESYHSPYHISGRYASKSGSNLSNYLSTPGLSSSNLHSSAATSPSLSLEEREGYFTSLHLASESTNLQRYADQVAHEEQLRSMRNPLSLKTSPLDKGDHTLSISPSPPSPQGSFTPSEEVGTDDESHQHIGDVQAAVLIPLPQPRPSEDMYIRYEQQVQAPSSEGPAVAERRLFLEKVITGTHGTPAADGGRDSADSSSSEGGSVAVDEKALDKGNHIPSRLEAAKIWTRAWIQRHYFVLTPVPTIVMPSAPSDEEKLSYLVTHRFLLCTIGVFGFLASSAGIWLFTVCAAPFYFFGVFACFIQFYLSVFYITGCFSKNFDYKTHQEILATYPVTCAEDAPTVDIYLPCCKEPLDVLKNTYEHVKLMKYPEGRLKVHVLDDGAMDSVKVLAESYGFNYIRREDRPRLKKAGNLRWAFARTSGEFFVIFDADFCPRADYCVELVPRMKGDPNIAIIQTPHYFRTDKNQTWVERGAGSVQELFYRFIQTNRDKWGGAICVGSNAIYRREALKDTGGTAEVGASEDVHTGFFAVERGWQLRYMPINLACGISPDTTRAFFSQQVRWCQGSTSLLINREFWKSALSWRQKGCYLSGMLYYSASALGLFTNPAPGILLMWFRIQYLNYYNLFFAIPSILYGIIVFRLWSRSTHSLAVAQIGVIQQYAYLSALVDRVIGTSFDWVPSGDGNAHKSDRYRNYRLLACAWTFTYQGLFISACTVRMIGGHSWYSFFPLILLDIYQIYITLPFLLST